MSRRDALFANFEKYKDFTDNRIRTGIEENRKGYATVTVTDEKGQPIPGAQIHLHQAKHEFKYGANIFMLDQLETAEKNDAYKRHFCETFNMATLPFYWKDLEPERGKPRYAADSPEIYRRPAPDKCLAFCEENGIEPREHALAYEQMFPKWLSHATDREVKIALEKRYREIAERYADKIPTIEVTNEMLWNTGITHFYRADDYLEWCYRMAEKYFPNNTIAINEWSSIWEDCHENVSLYRLIIENLLLRGCRIDAIAMQYHMFFRQEDEIARTAPYYNPKKLYDVLDMYGKFRREIQISEVTVPAYSDNPEDEEIQADLIERLYSIWFSHKDVRQIIYWNLVDGYAFGAKPGDMTSGENYYYGGLLRFDLTPKPAFERIQHLFRDVWHTEADIVTGANGTGSFNGFFGDYDVTVTAGEKQKTVRLSHLSTGNRDFTITL